MKYKFAMRSLLSRCLNISIGVLLISPGLAIACPPTPKPALNCLPSGIKAGTIVSANMMANNQVKQITVKQTLQTLGASCKGKRLVDRPGREIRFFQQVGCTGAPPPPDLVKQWEIERAKLTQLKKRYTVIELTCNATGIPLP
jgi:hypothetical protein